MSLNPYKKLNSFLSKLKSSPTKIGIFSLLLFSLISCDNRDYKILSNRNSTTYSLTVNEIMHVFRKKKDAKRLKIEYKPERSVEENLKMLIDKKVDFVITQNDVNFNYKERISARDTAKKFSDDNVRVASSLYPEVLFILYADSIAEPKNLEDLLRNRKVHLGSGEKSAKVIMEALMEHFEVDISKINFVKDGFNTKIKNRKPEVVCYLTNPADPFIEELLYKKSLRIFSFDKKVSELNSSRVAGFTMKYTPAYPFVVPVESFGKQPYKPTVTLAINAVLLTRTDVSQYFIYELLDALHRSKNTNLLLSFIDESTENLDNLYYYPHEGALDYYNQDHPTFIERYGRTIAAFGTVLLAGITAIIRWRNNRRFRRIQKYYALAVDVEKSLSTHWNEVKYLEQSLDVVLRIKEDVYDLLAEGKLEVNLNFLAFQEMIDSLIDQINVSRQNAILLDIRDNRRRDIK